MFPTLFFPTTLPPWLPADTVWLSDQGGVLEFSHSSLLVYKKQMYIWHAVRRS